MYIHTYVARLFLRIVYRHVHTCKHMSGLLVWNGTPLMVESDEDSLLELLTLPVLSVFGLMPRVWHRHSPRLACLQKTLQGIGRTCLVT